MAGKKLTWIFELQDRFSGPTKAIDRALGAVNKTMKSTSSGAMGSFGKLGQLFSKAMGPQIMGTLNKLGGSMRNFASTAKPVATELGSLLGTAAVGVAAVAAAVGAASLGMAVAGGRFVLQAAVFKEDSLAAFEAILGSKSEADKVMAMATKFAAKTPFKTSEVVDMAKALATRGFKGDELEKLMMGVGDVGALLGMEKMDSVINALGKMRAGGKLTGETLAMLSDAGINQKLVMGSLASQLGKTEEQIKQMLAAGQITDAQGVKATMDAIAKGLSGGTLGGAMDKKSKTLSGLFSTFESIPEELVFAANLDGAINPIKDFVKDLTAMLGPDTPAGKRVIGMLEQIADVVGSAFGVMRTMLPTAIPALLNVLEPMVTIFSAVWKGLSGTLGKSLMPVLDRLSKMDPKVAAESIESWIKLGEVLGKVIGFIISAGIFSFEVGAFIADAAMVPIRAWQAFTDFFVNIGTTLVATFESWKAQISAMSWSELGMSIGQGIINGLIAMMAPGGAAGGMLADAVANGIKQKLGIASPSTVTTGYGQDTGQGLINGIQSKAGGVASAIAAMLSPLTSLGAPKVSAPSVAHPGAAPGQGDTGPTGLFGALAGALPFMGGLGGALSLPAAVAPIFSPSIAASGGPASPAPTGLLDRLMGAIAGPSTPSTQAPAQVNVQNAAIQPAAASGPSAGVTAAAGAGAGTQEFNVQVPAGAVVINVPEGGDGASTGKAAADGFLGQIGSALRGVAGEMGG